MKIAARRRPKHLAAAGILVIASQLLGACDSDKPPAPASSPTPSLSTGQIPPDVNAAILRAYDIDPRQLALPLEDSSPAPDRKVAKLLDSFPLQPEDASHNASARAYLRELNLRQVPTKSVLFSEVETYPALEKSRSFISPVRDLEGGLIHEAHGRAAVAVLGIAVVVVVTDKAIDIYQVRYGKSVNHSIAHAIDRWCAPPPSYPDSADLKASADILYYSHRLSTKREEIPDQVIPEPKISWLCQRAEEFSSYLYQRGGPARIERPVHWTDPVEQSPWVDTPSFNLDSAPKP